MDGLGAILAIFALFAFGYSIFDFFKGIGDRDGRVGNYNASNLKSDAKIVDIKTQTTGTKGNKYFRIIVKFNDGFQYTKAVKPTTSSMVFTTINYTLSVEDKANVIKEAISEHDKALNNTMKKMGKTTTGNALLEFNNTIFPNGDSSKEYQKKQMKILMGEIEDDSNYLKTFIYCLTHYLVNKENYQYVVEMLPVAHPEIIDEKTIKRIAAYTFVFAGSKQENLDLSKEEDIKIIDNFVAELDNQAKNIESNSKENEKPFDFETGTVRNKPMFFKGVRAAETYLNSLQDLEGNKLHFGSRYSYSVDGINGMLDCYTMLNSKNDIYGQLYISIYGADNYQYVPKGYKHPKFKNPDIEINNNDNIETNSNEDIEKSKQEKEPDKYTSERAIKELNSVFEEQVEIKKQDSPNARTASDLIKEQINEEKNKEIKNEKGTDQQSKESKPQNTRYCRKCGTKLSDDAIFCRKCGTKVEF